MSVDLGKLPFQCADFADAPGRDDEGLFGRESIIFQWGDRVAKVGLKLMEVVAWRAGDGRGFRVTFGPSGSGQMRVLFP